MKVFRNACSAFIITTTVVFAPIAAHATGSAGPQIPTDQPNVVTYSDHNQMISIRKEEVNTTPHQGLAFTVHGITAEAISISEDGSQLVVTDHEGKSAIRSESPTLKIGSTSVEAKFIQHGTTVVVSPIHPPRLPRAACASSLWGNVIFNVGMIGVCGALGAGTVVGGPICSAALLAANTQINWDSHCK